MKTSPETPLVFVRSAELPADVSSVELVRLLAHEVAAMCGYDTCAVEASSCERELAEPTYVGHGMAVPHARVAGLPGAVAYVARSRAGIAWGSGTAQVVVFTAAPEEQPEVYLQMLSLAIRWRLRFPGGEEALLSAAPDELLAGLQDMFGC